MNHAMRAAPRVWKTAAQAGTRGSTRSLATAYQPLRPFAVMLPSHNVGRNPSLQFGPTHPPFAHQSRHFSAASNGDDGQAENAAVQANDSPPTPPDHAKIPGVKTGGSKLAIMYTCTAELDDDGGVCGTRSAKVFTKQAYENGVVIVRCPGCLNQHLIADRLGWFDDDSWDIERLMSERGEGMVKLEEDGTLEVLHAGSE